MDIDTTTFIISVFVSFLIESVAGTIVSLWADSRRIICWQNFSCLLGSWLWLLMTHDPTYLFPMWPLHLVSFFAAVLALWAAIFLPKKKWMQKLLGSQVLFSSIFCPTDMNWQGFIFRVYIIQRHLFIFIYSVIISNIFLLDIFYSTIC